MNQKQRHLKVLVANFQGIFNKKDQLNDFLITENIDIVIGSESHLKPSIKDNEFLLQNCSSFRNDR